MNKIKDYLILFKFRVWTLLIYSGILSYLIATKAGYNFDIQTFIFLFIAGSLSIMGNGALNEYLEVEIDKKMKRTLKRPLVRGTISKNFAFISGILLISFSITLSILFINIITTIFIIIATVIYLLYTYLKTKTVLNVIIGGFAGSCTAWGGWSAATNSMNLFGFLLGLLIYVWTNPHIWALALKYKDDYNNANIKMLTAIVDEKKGAKIITLSSIPLPILTLIIGILGSLSIYFLILSLIITAIFIILGFWIFINPKPEKAWVLFKFSTPYLAIIFLLIYIDPNEIVFII